jgi:hypothetical protein
MAVRHGTRLPGGTAQICCSDQDRSDIQHCTDLAGRVADSLRQVAAAGAYFHACVTSRHCNKTRAGRLGYVPTAHAECPPALQTMLVLGIRQPSPGQGSNFWHIPAVYARDTLEEAAELVVRVMKNGDIFFDEDEDLAEKLDAEDALEQENPGARPGAFDEAAAEYAAEQAAGRGESGAGAESSARTGELDKLEMMEQRLAASRSEMMDDISSSDDDDADELRAAMEQPSDTEQEAGEGADARAARLQKKQKARKDKSDKKKEAAQAAAAAAAAAAELRQARAAKAAKELRAAEQMEEDAEESQVAASPAAAAKRKSGGGGRLAKRKKLRAAPADEVDDSEDDLDLGLDDDGLDIDEDEAESPGADTDQAKSEAPAAAPAERSVGGRRAAMMMSSKCRTCVPACLPARWTIEEVEILVLTVRPMHCDWRVIDR